MSSRYNDEVNKKREKGKIRDADDAMLWVKDVSMDGSWRLKVKGNVRVYRDVKKLKRNIVKVINGPEPLACAQEEVLNVTC